MFSTIWQLIKLLRYLLPFLQDVSDENYCINDNDRLKARSIKGALIAVAWKLAFILIFFFTTFYYTIPLYSRNAVLEQELKERENVITDLKHQMNIAVDAQYVAMSNTQSCNIRLQSLLEENKRLRQNIEDLRFIETQCKANVYKPTNKPVVVNSNKKDKIDKTISDRIKKIQ